jgi:outer membrane immunogenic protein
MRISPHQGGIMTTQKLAVCAATALVLCVGVETSYAQSWTGPYVGATVGIGKQPTGGSKTVRFDKTLDGDFSDTILTAAGVNAFGPGFCAGAAVSAIASGGCTTDDGAPDYGLRGGYDWQIGRFVVGAVGEISWADQTSSVSAFSTTPAFYTFTRDLNWLGGFRGRAGYGAGRFLLYGTGGLARASVDHSFSTSNAVNTFVPSGDEGVWGYQAGGGLEIRAVGRWSFGAEYLMTGLDDKDQYTVRVQGPAPATNPFILTNPAGTDLRRADQFEFYSVRLTAGYRF